MYAGVRELDINLAVVDAIVPMLERRGWTVIVFPATVPPGLRADVFVSIHADWAGDPNRRGWKLAPPWRPRGIGWVHTDELVPYDRLVRRESEQDDRGGL